MKKANLHDKHSNLLSNENKTTSTVNNKNVEAIGFYRRIIVIISLIKNFFLNIYDCAKNTFCQPFDKRTISETENSGTGNNSISTTTPLTTLSTTPNKPNELDTKNENDTNDKTTNNSLSSHPSKAIHNNDTETKIKVEQKTVLTQNSLTTPDKPEITPARLEQIYKYKKDNPNDQVFIVVFVSDKYTIDSDSGDERDAIIREAGGIDHINSELRILKKANNNFEPTSPEHFHPRTTNVIRPQPGSRLRNNNIDGILGMCCIIYDEKLDIYSSKGIDAVMRDVYFELFEEIKGNLSNNRTPVIFIDSQFGFGITKDSPPKSYKWPEDKFNILMGKKNRCENLKTKWATTMAGIPLPKIYIHNKLIDIE